MFPSWEDDGVKLYEVPEPVTMAMLGIGGLVIIRRKK